MRDPRGDTHTALGTTAREQPLPSSVPKHEEEDAEYDARDADVDPNDDAGCGGFIVLLVLHAVARGIQHCQRKGGEGGQQCCFPIAPPAFGEPKSKSRSLGGAGSCVRGRGEQGGGPGGSLPAKAAPLLLVLLLQA